MTATESTIPVGDTGKLLDSTTVTHADGTEAEREGVFVGDPGIAENRLRLLTLPNALEGDLAVPIRGDALNITNELLGCVLTELKSINLHLAKIRN